MIQRPPDRRPTSHAFLPFGPHERLSIQDAFEPGSPYKLVSPLRPSGGKRDVRGMDRGRGGGERIALIVIRITSFGRHDIA